MVHVSLRANSSCLITYVHAMFYKEYIRCRKFVFSSEHPLIPILPLARVLSTTSTSQMLDACAGFGMVAQFSHLGCSRRQRLAVGKNSAISMGAKTMNAAAATLSTWTSSRLTRTAVKLPPKRPSFTLNISAAVTQVPVKVIPTI